MLHKQLHICNGVPFNRESYSNLWSLCQTSRKIAILTLVNPFKTQQQFSRGCQSNLVHCHMIWELQMLLSDRGDDAMFLFFCSVASSQSTFWNLSLHHCYPLWWKVTAKKDKVILLDKLSHFINIRKQLPSIQLCTWGAPNPPLFRPQGVGSGLLHSHSKG